MARLQRLIDECEQHRPLGPDGKHDNRHTPTCGCEADMTDLEAKLRNKVETGRISVEDADAVREFAQFLESSGPPPGREGHDRQRFLVALSDYDLKTVVNLILHNERKLAAVRDAVETMRNEAPIHYFDCDRFQVYDYGTRQGACDCSANRDLEEISRQLDGGAS